MKDKMISYESYTGAILKLQKNTIEEMLHSRQKKPICTLALIKDICRRIKKLEAKK